MCIVVGGSFRAAPAVWRQVKHGRVLITAVLYAWLRFSACSRARLKASFPAGDGEHIWRETLKLQSELKAKRPKHSPGVNLILRYLECDCARRRRYIHTRANSRSRRRQGRPEGL